jgi:hypothetical protein
MPFRLPPLSPLRFFEAAGRHQRFKLAAAELNVTASAISHGIVGLEQALGSQLFVRGVLRLLQSVCVQMNNRSLLHLALLSLLVEKSERNE